MSRKNKIGLIIVGLIILLASIFIVGGLYTMDIEDYYGANQEIFYNSRQGDLVVNHTTRELGEIRKTWTRFFIVNNDDTVDIYEWWDDKQIEIYRPVDTQLHKGLSYGDIGDLIRERKIELIKKLR